MNKKQIVNTLFFIIATYALYIRVPSIINHFKYQDQKAPDFTIKTLSDEEFSLNKQSKKIVLIFWATWCGPCEVELKLINKMIINKEILPSDVLAIVSQEDEKTIAQTVKQENYLFKIGLDSNGAVARLYQISSTPTVVFIDEKQIINWMTSGLSPTLKYRLSAFFK